MPIGATEKAQTISEYARKKDDTGSPEVQIALLTQRILHLTDHVKIYHHDFHSRRGLVSLVSKRRKLLKYLKNIDAKRYRDLITRLNLRDSF